MKKLVEEVVERNQNLIEYITRLAAESNSWIFVSKDLYEQLGVDYRKEPFYKEDGAYFYDNNQKYIGLQSEKSNCSINWKEVTSISERGVYTAWTGDPEVIYFLS